MNFEIQNIKYKIVVKIICRIAPNLLDLDFRDYIKNNSRYCRLIVINPLTTTTNYIATPKVFIIFVNLTKITVLIFREIILIACVHVAVAIHIYVYSKLY